MKKSKQRDKAIPHRPIEGEMVAAFNPSKPISMRAPIKGTAWVVVDSYDRIFIFQCKETAEFVARASGPRCRMAVVRYEEVQEEKDGGA